MIRLFPIASAVIATAVVATIPVAATAQDPAGYYVATPAAAPTKTSFITDELMWKWKDTAFVAKQGTHRDGITCQMVAKSTGKLAAFTAAGTAFDPDALAKCNARAK